MQFHDGIFIDMRQARGRLSRRDQNAILLGLYGGYFRSKKLLSVKPEKTLVVVSPSYARFGGGVTARTLPSGEIVIGVASKRRRVPPFWFSSIIASHYKHELHHLARRKRIGFEKFHKGNLAENVVTEGLALAFERETGQPSPLFVDREKIAIMACRFFADYDVKGKYGEWIRDGKDSGYAFSDAFVQSYLTATGQKASQAVGVDAMEVVKLWISEGCKAVCPQPRYVPRLKSKRLFRPTWRVPQYKHLNTLRQSKRACFG